MTEIAAQFKDRSPLLPDRNPTPDFFVSDIFDAVPKGDMASMEHPIFSLSTKPGTHISTYVATGGQEVVDNFGLIERVTIVRETRDGRNPEEDPGNYGRSLTAHPFSPPSVWAAALVFLKATPSSWLWLTVVVEFTTVKLLISIAIRIGSTHEIRVRVRL